jgi:hypothetical protein
MKTIFDHISYMISKSVSFGLWETAISHKPKLNSLLDGEHFRHHEEMKCLSGATKNTLVQCSNSDIQKSLSEGKKDESVGIATC